QAAALRVRSPGAAGLPLALRVERLPAGAVLRVAGAQGPAQAVAGGQVLAALARDAAAGVAGRRYWLPAVAGEEALLQVTLPAGSTPADLALAVPEAAHLWWTHAAVTRAAALKVGEAGTCNADAACSPAYESDQRSVARLEFIEDGQAFVCTGTLLADVAATGTPWMLNANHCIGSQAAASTASTYWFYRAAACGSDRLDPAATQRHGGATLLHANAATDTAFLRLEQSLPAGVVHAGVLLGPVAVGSEVASLHHAGGDLLKLSVGSVQSYADCDGTRCSTVAGTEGNYLSLGWRVGTTESGSSGSAAFVAAGGRRYVAGHLFAGLASCADPGRNDFYGRIDREYPALRPYLGDVPGT
ncbi:trypsin-like serine peptidase, partial [Ramlibacter sp. MAHUQ-53]|uniref:trypsin-like serine peptidase n=1 Tax=unclassified Ramlibacter TaxID=2617605 RepID=UPI0036273A13